jgi:hypothetical protein
MPDTKDTATVVLTTEERHFITRMALAERPTDAQIEVAKSGSSAEYLAYLEGEYRLCTELVAKLDEAYLASVRNRAEVPA